MLGMLKQIKHRFFSLEGFYGALSHLKGLKRGRLNDFDRPVVVSLTAVPWRFEKLHLVLMSLLWQKIRPDHIVLWLSKYDQNGTQITTIEDLPKNIRRLHRMGVEIEFVEDIRSYRKLLPALERFPNAIVVTADDDILYPSGWLENLLRGHEQHTDAIVCYRGTQILLDQNGLAPYKQWPEYTRRDEPSYLLFAQGGEGALYPPGSLHPEVQNREAFMHICPTADDVWFKAMALYNNVPHVKITDKHQDFPRIRGSQAEGQSLHHVNNILGHNDHQVAAVFSRYNLEARLKESEEQV
jgi:hypothetical protein